MAEQCPICLNAAEWGRDKDYGDKRQIRCPRCGPFEITRTALAMLGSRVEQDPLARARLSHAIRSNTSEKNWTFISSTNVDELVRRALPDIPHQLELLARWLAAQLGEDRFGHIAQPRPEFLASIVGTPDGDGAKRLIAYATKQGVIDRNETANSLGLTPEGWAMLEPSPKKEGPKTKVSAESIASEIVKAHCNQCGGDRKAYKRASYTVHGNDGETSWSHTYDVLECCGCAGMCVRHEFWFSEWDQFDYDPLTGQPQLVPGIKVTYWPSPTKRKKPEWADNLDDDVLRSVADEVYQALNAGLIVLASVGTRTLLDRAMFLRVGDRKGGFAGKLAQMVEQGHIGRGEKDILQAITDAGSAAAHRGFAPNAKTLGTIIDTVENFLQREFMLKKAVGEVREETPPRAMPAKTS